jgi:hypothetical protein
VERAGEVAIAKAAAVLRDEALKRIDEIERESRRADGQRGEYSEPE